MPCSLTSGRRIPCKDTVGGLKTIWLTTSGIGVNDLTLGSDGEITAIAGNDISVMQYDLKGNNSLSTAIQSSPENGTVFFESTLTVQLPKLLKEDLKELKLIAFSRPKIFIQTRNNDVLFMGHIHGCELSGSIESGTAFGDFNGINMTFLSQEKVPPQFVLLANATDADPFAGDNDITVTYGAAV